MTDQTPATRTEISARLMAVAEHTIVAEWICCEPLDPTHDLCAKGYATLEMTRALLVDDPEASVTAAPLLDAVMGLLPAAVPVPPPADQTALRDRIAEALHQDQTPPPVVPWKDELPLDREYFLKRADAVLAVLPEQTDRAAVLRWAADRLTEDAAKGAKEGWTRIYQRAAATKLRIWAAEEQPTETPEPEDDEAEKLAKARRMAKAFSAPPVAPPEWATTTEWPGRHKRAGDRRVHATAAFGVNGVRRFWTACGKNVGQGGYPLSHMPVDCRSCREQLERPAVGEQPETQETRVECAHCWREIENRGTPSMGGNHHVKWVHVPGGFTVCFPQRGGDSPRAEPRTPE